MGFEGTETYACDVETAIAGFANEAMIVGRYEDAGDSDIEVLTCDFDGDEATIVTKRTVGVDLPGFAKKVLQPTNTMTQTDRWSAAADDGSRTGTFETKVDGAPVTTTGSMSLSPVDGGCEHRVAGEIKVKVPVIGGRIAKWSVGTARDGLAHEFAYNKQHLENT